MRVCEVVDLRIFLKLLFEYWYLHLTIVNHKIKTLKHFNFISFLLFSLSVQTPLRPDGHEPKHKLFLDQNGDLGGLRPRTG